MLIRDNVAKELMNAFDKVKEKEVDIVTLSSDEEFFQAIISKIRSEIDLLEMTKSIQNLAELVELIDWLQVSLGTSKLSDVIEERQEKLGLYWGRYFIKEQDD
jgi:predicted house-cleaning noncanonical NTP pyrophosphatase (MazG superfamily)